MINLNESKDNKSFSISEVFNESLSESVDEVKNSKLFKLTVIAIVLLISFFAFILISMFNYKEEITSSNDYPITILETIKSSSNIHLQYMDSNGSYHSLFIASCNPKPNLSLKKIVVKKVQYVYNSIIGNGAAERIDGIRNQICQY